jgi:hypothetical protein
VKKALEGITVMHSGRLLRHPCEIAGCGAFLIFQTLHPCTLVGSNGDTCGAPDMYSERIMNELIPPISRCGVRKESTSFAAVLYLD